MNVIILETSPTSVDLISETELQLRRKTASKDSKHREDQQWTVSQTTKHRPTDSNPDRDKDKLADTNKDRHAD